MVEAHCFTTYIAGMSLIIYYHSLFYSLGHDVTIVTSYCPAITPDTMVAPEWQRIDQSALSIYIKWKNIIIPQ